MTVNYILQMELCHLWFCFISKDNIGNWQTVWCCTFCFLSCWGDNSRTKVVSGLAEHSGCPKHRVYSGAWPRASHELWQAWSNGRFSAIFPWIPSFSFGTGLFPFRSVNCSTWDHEDNWRIKKYSWLNLLQSLGLFFLQKPLMTRQEADTVPSTPTNSFPV